MSNTEQSRLEFESWVKDEIKKKYHHINAKELMDLIFSCLELNSNGDYRNIETIGQFDGWKARENEIEQLRNEIRIINEQLNESVYRIKDMLEGDDGQAYKEAEKFLVLLEKSK